ncbi:FAD-binding oxidoreductase [Paenarthrobacter sp. Z7-10]|uniref:NAD(P)/FAD-dependent oxidoreductase n=1 Tax=Paenarthrobacter sp. Z7-10 TaxID=2787635 RepID=UPI0022A92AF8|nr:FAD-dependent oxidoreductase [Paenarthrobacter sp. Z7-10]MCZ2403639.1 FAD-binding oxidoreductase [Paenarthrobacter sp. Z7-10]
MNTHHVLVVGSGAAGASTAYALARKGARVTLVDSDYEGQATAAGAGIVQPWSTEATGTFQHFYTAGAEYYPTLIADLNASGVPDIGYRRSGALIVSRDAGRLDQVNDRVAARARGSALAGEVARMGNARARELFPPLAKDLEGLYISGGARVDGRTLRNALIRAMCRHGGSLVAGVARLEHSSSHSGSSHPGVSVWVGDHAIPADAVVVAAGAWTNAVLRPLGRRLPIEPQRGQITHLRLPGADTARWPTVHPLTGHYLVAFEDSRIVIGATRETGSGFDPRVTAAGQLQILTNALEIAPGLADATFIETRVGLRPVSGNELPFIGPVTGIPGLYVNAGFGAVGLTMGPYAGNLLSDLILQTTPGTAPKTDEGGLLTAL